MLNYRRVHLAVLVVAGLFVPSTASRAVEPRLLPANTEIVVSVNIKQILESEMVKGNVEAVKTVKAMIEANIPNYDQAAKYLKMMDFDLFNDITSITYALPGTMDPADSFVVIDAKFNDEKFRATALKAAADNPGIMRVSKFGTTPVYEVQAPGIPGDHLYIALVNGKSLVITPHEDVLKGAITRSGGVGIAATKVKDLLKATSDKQSFNFVLTGPVLGELVKMAKAKGADIKGLPAIKDVPAIEGLTGSFTLTKEINFQLGLGTKTDKEARELANLGDGVLALAKLLVVPKLRMNPDYVPLVEVIQTLRVSAVGPNAVITGSVTQENLEKLIKLIGEKIK